MALRLTILLSVAALALSGCGVRGPRGYYVQKEDPTVYVEFIDERKARSNMLKEFGDADYGFFAASEVLDDTVRIFGPLSAEEPKRHQFEVYGDGDEIKIQDLSAAPVLPDRAFPVTHYTRRKE